MSLIFIKLQFKMVLFGIAWSLLPVCGLALCTVLLHQHINVKDVIGQNNVVDVGKLSSENTNDTNRKEATAVPTLASL